jgi:hypothetical protein
VHFGLTSINDSSRLGYLDDGELELLRIMSISLKRPRESVDTPQSQEDRDGRHLGAIEPKPSFEAQYVVQYPSPSLRPLAATLDRNDAHTIN